MKNFKVLSVAFSLMAVASSAVASEGISFSRACERGQNITISAVGDILLHETLQRRAVKENSFAPLWEEVTPYFETSDYSYGNLESPAAEGTDKTGARVRDPGFVYDGKVYSSYPMFNYHPSIIRELKKSGLDILSTANNHSLDRQSRGIDQTLKEIEKEDIQLVGTRYKKDQKKDKLEDWYRVTDINGVKVAWIGCTFIMNYTKYREEKGAVDPYDQVMFCKSTKGQARIQQIISEQKKEVDAIIITPHWGDEYVNTPNAIQKEFGRKWIEMGATAVIGSHPHVLQPMEKVVTKDGREGFIIYSLGNFVSNQGGKESECAGEKSCLAKKLAQRSSVTLFLGLTKNSSGTFINGVKALPMRMVNQYDNDKIKLDLIEREFSEFDAELARDEKARSPETFGEGRDEVRHIKTILPKENLIYNGEEVLTNSGC